MPKNRPPAPDLRAAMRAKKAVDRTVKRVKDTINGRRVAALVEQETALQEVAEVKEAVISNADLRERISLLVKGSGPAYTLLNPEEKAIIVELYHEGISRRRIAEIIGRDIHTVSNFLKRYASTVTAGRMYFEANADKLARRVVKNANVEESLEVLDRLDVLPAKGNKDRGGGGASFNVMIGVPGSGSVNGGPIPIPSQREIVAAKIVPTPPAPAPSDAE